MYTNKYYKMITGAKEFVAYCIKYMRGTCRVLFAQGTTALVSTLEQPLLLS